jgi:TolB-like protein/DNA-binding winged helix-turn-helix (wHTH) protein/Flp pilus assembly protein TadD
MPSGSPITESGLPRRVARFAAFEFDLGTGELRKHGLRIKLNGQPVDVLKLLIEHAGEVVTREELQKRLWASDTYVDFEHSLNAAIKRLRAALGDSADEPRFVETLARQGYRFIAPLSQPARDVEAVPEVQPPPGEGEPKRVLLTRRRILQAGGGAAAAGAVLGVWELLPAKWRNRLSGSDAPRITRLAVLPLANLSGNLEQEYFADGMTDLLITDLGQIGAIRVISRPSIMQFKATKEPLPEIAKKLGVQALIVGSVQSSGNRVRVTAQLVDGATEQQLWTHAYERELTDVLAMQGEVARAIADEIEAQVTPEEAGRLSRNHKVVPAALNAYLLGRYYWDQFQEEAIVKAIDYFDQAIQLDPAYAAAYGGLAECWAAFLFTDARPWAENITKARDAATKGLELDDTLAETHSAMAAVYYEEWNWKGVESEVKKAIALNAGFPTAHMLYCNMTRHLGRANESIAEAKLALEADPLAMLTNQMLGDAYISARRYDLAIAQLQKALDLHPNDTSLQYQLGWAYVYSGAYEQGTESIRNSQAADGVDPRLSPDLACINAMTGKPEKTRQTLNKLLTLAKNSPVSPGLIALVYAVLDERAQCLTWLNKAYAQHSSMMTWLKVDPRFDKIRPEPGFQDLMRRVGLI